jgi:hypothetical protein
LVSNFRHLRVPHRLRKMVDQLSEVSTDPLPFLSQDLAEESRQRRSDRTGQETASPQETRNAAKCWDM